MLRRQFSWTWKGKSLCRLIPNLEARNIMEKKSVYFTNWIFIFEEFREIFTLLNFNYILPTTVIIHNITQPPTEPMY